MSGDNIYLLTALPTLGELGSVPPISPSQLLEMVTDSKKSRILVETLLISNDLLQRQAFLSGEIEEPYPIVLTRQQVTDNEPLPEYLEEYISDTSGESTLNAIWEAYYRYAEFVADQHRSAFLKEFIKYEIGLRNALARARAKALNIDPHDSIVAQDLGEDDTSFTALISEWTSATDPLKGLRVLDEARFKWLWENDEWFTFHSDELVAYAAKLMLLHRWYQIEKGPSSKSQEVRVNE